MKKLYAAMWSFGVLMFILAEEDDGLCVFMYVLPLLL